MDVSHSSNNIWWSFWKWKESKKECLCLQSSQLWKCSLEKYNYKKMRLAALNLLILCLGLPLIKGKGLSRNDTYLFPNVIILSVLYFTFCLQGNDYHWFFFSILATIFFFKCQRYSIDLWYAHFMIQNKNCVLSISFQINMSQ